MATSSARPTLAFALALALPLSLGLSPGDSRADATAPSPKDVDDARILREAAAGAAAKKDYATCKDKAAESFARAKQPQSWGLEGLCEAELKQWRDAAEHLAYAVQFDTNPKRVAEYQIKLTEAKTKVGAFDVKTTPQACELRVDDRPVGQSPRELFVNPGRYRITAEAKGFESKTIEVEITAGSAKPVPIDLSPVVSSGGTGGAPDAATSSSTSSGGDTSTSSGVVEPVAKRPVWPIAVGYGLAAVGLGVGIGTAVAANAEPDFDCLGTQCAEGDAYEENQETMSNASFWSFIAGGTVALATTGYLIWAVSAPKAKAPTALVVPFASPSSGGAVFLGRF